MDASEIARIERRRRRFRPRRIEVLMIGESVPDGGTFFYFANSLLYRATQAAFARVYGSSCGTGNSFLRFFQSRGFYLHDLCRSPVDKLPRPERKAACQRGEGALARFLRRARPQVVIICPKSIRGNVGTSLSRAGVRVVIHDLPFPNYRWGEFVSKLSQVVRQSERV